MAILAEQLNLTGALFLPAYRWFWMLVSLGLGAWVGWRTAGEPQTVPPPEDGA